jgi:hypothetical protein
MTEQVRHRLQRPEHTLRHPRVRSHGTSPVQW